MANLVCLCFCLLDANTGACAVRQAVMIFTRLFRFVLSLQCGLKGGGGPPNSGHGGSGSAKRDRDSQLRHHLGHMVLRRQCSTGTWCQWSRSTMRQ